MRSIHILSDATLSLCRGQFFGGGCDGCPIKTPCHEVPKGRHDDEAMNQWREKLNEAADQYLVATA